MKKQYIIPASRVRIIRCVSPMLTESDPNKLMVSNEETTEQLVKEEASWSDSESGSGNWGTGW